MCPNTKLVAGATILFRRKDNGTRSYPLLLNARNRKSKHSTQMKFELIQILRSCQCHHTGVMRTGGKFGEVNAILVAQEEFNSNRRMGVVLCYAPLDSDLDALRDKAKRIAEKVEVY